MTIDELLLIFGPVIPESDLGLNDTVDKQRVARCLKRDSLYKRNVLDIKLIPDIDSSDEEDF